MKPVSPPLGGSIVEVLPPEAPRHNDELTKLARLHDEAAAQLSGVLVLRLRGDSMAPTFQSGEFALVDAGDTDISSGGVFAVAESGSVIVTQIEPVYDAGRSSGRIRCTPRNAAYSSFELCLGLEAQVIGRVVRKVTRL